MEIGVKSIEDFIINLLAGRPIISNLYKGLSKAIDHRNTAKQYFHCFYFPDVDGKTYNAMELMDLYNDSHKFHHSQLLENFHIDNVVRILFKYMDPINKLYEAEDKANEINCNGRRFYFTFNNPFRAFIKLDTQYTNLSGDKLLELIEIADKKHFENFLVW